MGIKFNPNDATLTLDYLQNREFIQTGSKGSYSMSTIIGFNTRKYHGVYVAPQPAIDEDQHVLLSAMPEEVIIGEQVYCLHTQQYPGIISPEGYKHVHKIEIDKANTHHFSIGDGQLIKEQLHLENGQVLIKYTLENIASAELVLKPLLAFRNKHQLTRANPHLNESFTDVNGGVGFQLYNNYQQLLLQFNHDKMQFNFQPSWFENIEYQRELERGYEYTEDLWNPGYFSVVLKNHDSFILSIGLEESKPDSFDKLFAKAKKPGLKTFEDHLDHAAQQFITDDHDTTRIIAGFPWFGRWGRDTFIALPGLTLSRKDPATCKAVIDTISTEMVGPLFPNLGTGEYTQINSVDAPLWFFWALQQYALYTGQTAEIWKDYGEIMKVILKGFKEGTQFNIHMNEHSLIYAGHEGKALTWMDAVCNGEVFTPRRGMNVEINALWYNAICFALNLAKKSKDIDFLEEWKDIPDSIQQSFLELFWDAEKGYLADVVTDNFHDWSLRPNQIFAASLPHSMLNKQQIQSILNRVKEELLTPRGLRTLDRNHHDYIGVYFGNQYHRDAAYHQGTVWPWLIGHYCEAYLKLNGSAGLSHVKEIYQGFESTMDEHGIGSVSEIHDGDPPFLPRGATAQAWSVSELLRVKQMILAYSKRN